MGKWWRQKRKEDKEKYEDKGENQRKEETTWKDDEIKKCSARKEKKLMSEQWNERKRGDKT